MPSLPLPTEDDEHRAFVAWLRLKGYTFHHSPNATGHTAEARRRAGRMKALGTSPGFPDLIIFTGRHRIAIELKRRKGGRATPEQRQWLEVLAAHGFHAAICNGRDEAVEFVESVTKSPATDAQTDAYKQGFIDCAIGPMTYDSSSPF